jgi:hypothetical protein
MYLPQGYFCYSSRPPIRYQYYFLRTPARISHYPVSCDDTNAALATFLQDTAAMYRPCFDNNPTASRRLGLAYLTSYLLSSSPSPRYLSHAAWTDSCARVTRYPCLEFFTPCLPSSMHSAIPGTRHPDRSRTGATVHMHDNNMQWWVVAYRSTPILRVSRA